MVALEQRDKLWVGRFESMASPCEVLIETDDRCIAAKLIKQAETEARRIEQKFSRYREDNIVHRINNEGASISVDAETARLLDFADNCYQLSDGLFDITSGLLRRAWDFKPGGSLPSQATIEAYLPLIGWPKVEWCDPMLTVPEGMEIDFGGIGKEYAVDSVLSLLRKGSALSVMVNFGGDCHASGPLSNGDAWLTGIENPNHPGDATAIIKLSQGALATSGNVYKFIEEDGLRYGHIQNPTTGWPETEAPLSVTVAAATCTEAGVLSTLAMLYGADAESFLDEQEVKYWCYR